MTHAKGIKSLMAVDQYLNEDKASLPVHFPYRSVVGSLMYLMVCTCPDISYVVCSLTKHCESPTRGNWTALKRVLQYVKETRNMTLTYRCSAMYDIIGYCDSDWAGCKQTRKSTEGFVFLYGGVAISWRSKKQTVVATSSCEAEYIAA